MFRENNNHRQQSFFESTYWMNPSIKEKLQNSWAPLFYEHVFCNIDEKPFAALYSNTGAPNTPVNILISLDYIKQMRGLNDIDLLDSFYFDYQVNYALGIRTLGELNLSEKTLNNFRKRIYQYCIKEPDKEDLLFGQFITLLQAFKAESGVLLDAQRTDTTLFMSNIKKAGRLSLAYDVLVQAVKAIPENNRTKALLKVTEKDFKTDTLYRTKTQESDSKLAEILNLCNAAIQILEKDTDEKNCEVLTITKRFVEEQSAVNVDTGMLIPKPKKEISSNSMQSAYDQDATYRIKGDVRQSGYVLEISETCSKDNPFQLITDYAVKPNNVSDVEILRERLKPIKENTNCTEMYVDGGFHSPSVHEKAQDCNIAIHMSNMTGTEARKKFATTEFEIDPNTYEIKKCPNGKIPTHTGLSKSQTSAHFPHENCDTCDMRDQCFSKKQTKDYVVRIPVKAVEAGLKRVTMKKDQKVNTSMRAGIEGSNSALKRTGLKKLKVRGIIKSSLVSGIMVTVQNIKRFLKFLKGGYNLKTRYKPINGIVLPN